MFISKREKIQPKKRKSRKNYLNVRETKLTKRKAIITNQDKTIHEVEEENKKMTLSVSNLDKEMRKYRFMGKQLRELKQNVVWTDSEHRHGLLAAEKKASPMHLFAILYFLLVTSSVYGKYNHNNGRKITHFFLCLKCSLTEIWFF